MRSKRATERGPGERRRRPTPATKPRSGRRPDAERARLSRRLEDLTRYANDIVLVTDSEQNVIAANDRATEILGYTRSELLRMTLRDLRDPATLGDLDSRVREQRAAGHAVFETRYRRRDGSTFPVEVSVRVVEIDGHIYHQGTARDITERKRAEEDRAFQVKLLETLHEAVIGTDPELRIRSWNQAAERLYGWSASEAIGRHVRDVLGTEYPDGEAGRTRVFQAIQETGRMQVQLVQRRRDGTRIEVEGEAAALRGPDGHLTGYLIANRDITEKKALEAKLLFADRMSSIGTLAAGVAHEINNPLSFTLGNVDYALEELARLEPRPVNVFAALKDAREGATRVREIVRDLKTFSRSDEARDEPVDVARVLRSAMSLAHNEIRHRARLVVHLGEVPPVATSDHRLGQVFLNLLINAAQAIPEGHADRNEIRVSSRLDEDGRIRVEVADTGCGIAPEILPRIFEPFFTTKPVGVGTGLGLSICHGIVTGLGGEITVESRPGKGSTFGVLLPRAGQSRAAQAPTDGAGPQQAVRAGRILVVA